MREICTSGSERGAVRKDRPYRDSTPASPEYPPDGNLPDVRSSLHAVAGHPKPAKSGARISSAALASVARMLDKLRAAVEQGEALLVPVLLGFRARLGGHHAECAAALESIGQPSPQQCGLDTASAESRQRRGAAELGKAVIEPTRGDANQLSIDMGAISPEICNLEAIAKRSLQVCARWKRLGFYALLVRAQKAGDHDVHPKLVVAVLHDRSLDRVAATCIGILA